MGCGTSWLWHSCECYRSRRSDDAALPAMARHISESRGETPDCPRQDSPRKSNDFAGRDCRNGSISPFTASGAHYRPASVCGWRLRAPGPGFDVGTVFLMATPEISTRSAKPEPSLFPKGNFLPFFLVTALFFLWGVPNNLNDVLIRHFMKSFEITRFQAGLIQSAFYMGYFVLAIPAGLLMRRLGYKVGFITGLVLFGAGAFLFWPAALI